MSTLRDKYLCRKYARGMDINDNDRRDLDELRSVRFMKMGMSLQRNVVTAKTVGIGLKLIPGNKISRKLFSVAGILSNELCWAQNCSICLGLRELVGLKVGALFFAVGCYFHNMEL